MEFFTSPVVSNIVNLISLLATIISIVQGIKKDRSDKVQTNLTTVNCITIENHSSSRTSFGNTDIFLFGFGILAIGGIFRPHLEYMSLIFPLFWWTTMAIHLSFSKKRVVTKSGRNLIIIVLLEAVVTMVGLILVKQLPDELHLDIAYIEKLYQCLLSGFLFCSYFSLLFLGLLLMVLSLSKAGSHIEKLSSRLLNKYKLLPAVLLLGGIILLFMALYACNTESCM